MSHAVFSTVGRQDSSSPSSIIDEELKSMVLALQQRGILPTTAERVKRSGKRKPRLINSSEGSQIIREFLESLDHPRALTVWLLWCSEVDHRQLLELTCNPSDYSCYGDFRAAYAATKLLSKYSSLETGIDTESAAIASAFEAESVCASTNRRIRSSRDGVSHRWGSALFRASQIISKILGPLPDGKLFGCEGFFDDVGWSPGRTSSASGDRLSAFEKYRSQPHVTVRARKWALQLLSDSPLWTASVLHADAGCTPLPGVLPIIEGNVMLTVPKNAKTDRVICYEPHMNIRLQLSVGRYMRDRLRLFGVDLNDQSINQRRAKLGSLTGSLATIDLKSASDTIATELVLDLLPVDWVSLLDDLRSGYTLWPDGRWRENEKFSSMGNGFTFELESLIFYALCSAVSSNVSVYGDDIILPSEKFEEAKSLLEFCGFSINLGKSFSHGVFRESCGAEWYNGMPVVPVYLRKPLRRIGDVVKFHNAVRAWYCHYDNINLRSAYPDQRYPVLPDTFGERKGLSLIRKWRQRFSSFTGPRGFGDGHYHVELDEHVGYVRYSRFQHPIGWSFKTITSLKEKRRGFRANEYFAALCAALGPKRPLSIYESSSLGGQRLRAIRITVPYWPVTLWL